MKVSRLPVIAVVATLAASGPGWAQELPTITEFTQELAPLPGPVPAYFEPETGRLFLALIDRGDPILHVVALSTGATWPLDRGMIRWDRSAVLLRFHRIGRRIHLLEENRSYRALGNSVLEDVVAESFPSPSVGALPIVAADSTTYLVDGTAFLVRDAFDVVRELTEVGESAVFDPDRSGIMWPAPIESERSTDIDVRTTFRVAGGTSWVEDRSPDPDVLTVVQRHIFLRPEVGFAPRPTHESIGFNAVHVRDFGDVGERGFRSGWVQRWRLGEPGEDANRRAASIRVFLERSIPEVFRGAVREGLAYWAKAFEAIGLPDAIQVEDLPEGADPLDVEYPVVLVWSPRRQPMASMANLVSDPSTGELLKSIVHLDAHWPLVARNEYRSYRPALASGAPTEAEYVAARVAWAAAHEAGHFVAGLSHTGFRATAVGFRLPRLVEAGGRIELDLDSIVPARPLPYDLWALAYAYRAWPGSNPDSLRAHVARGISQGLRHIEYEAGRLMPQAASRIHGSDALKGMGDAIEVRSILLSHFGTASLHDGEPRARLIERLVPVYFHHRFALEAVARMLGGVRAGPGVDEISPIPESEQWQALDLLVELLQHTLLAVPRSVIHLMPPMPGASVQLDLQGETDRPGVFRFQTGATSPIDIAAAPGSPFDPTAWARALADMVVASMLNPIRASRLHAQAFDDSSLPTLADVIERLMSEIWWASAVDDPYQRELQQVARRVLLQQLIALVESDAASSAARSTVLGHLTLLRRSLSTEETNDPDDVAMKLEALKALDRVLN